MSPNAVEYIGTLITNIPRETHGKTFGSIESSRVI